MPGKGVDGSDWKAIRARLWSRVTCLFAMYAGGCTSIAIGVFRNVWNRELTDFLVPPQVVKTESTKLKPVGKT
jgi:hypothetical protein